MSYRQKIVYMQITLITVAIFLGLLVGAAALTKVMNNRQAQNSEKTASQEQQEETTDGENDPADFYPICFVFSNLQVYEKQS